MKQKMVYKGIRMAQAKGTEDVFEKFFKREGFDRVIELGTLKGGLTLAIAERYGGEYHSFDYIDKISDNTKRLLKDLGVNIYVENVFETDTVKKLIEGEGRALLLCDNGNKIKEVELFIPYLKSGDVIMAHDYHPNVSEYAKRRHIWKDCEITEANMKYNTLKTYPPYSEEFIEIFWGCKIKI